MFIKEFIKSKVFRVWKIRLNLFVYASFSRSDLFIYSLHTIKTNERLTPTCTGGHQTQSEPNLDTWPSNLKLRRAESTFRFGVVSNLFRQRTRLCWFTNQMQNENSSHHDVTLRQEHRKTNPIESFDRTFQNFWRHDVLQSRDKEGDFHLSVERRPVPDGF